MTQRRNIPHSLVGGIPPLVVAGVVGVVVLAGFAIGPWLQLTRLKQDVAAKEQTILTLTSQNQALQQQLDQLQTERSELERRLEGVRGQLTTATQELTALRDVQVRHDALQNEKARLEIEVARLARERNDAKEQARRLEAEKEELEHVAARLRNRLGLADRDYRQMRDRVAALERQLTQGGPAVSTGTTVGILPPRVEAMWPIIPQTVTSAPSLQTPERNLETSSSAPQHAPLPVLSPSGVVVKPAGPQEPANASSVPPPAEPSLPGQGGSVGSPPHQEAPAINPSTKDFGGRVKPWWGGSQTVELPPIIVRKERLPTMAAIRAQVVEVNPTHRFLIINQGAEDGVRIGMTFDLLRGVEMIGRAVAVRVRPRLAACDLIAPENADALHVGDLAVQRGP